MPIEVYGSTHGKAPLNVPEETPKADSLQADSVQPADSTPVSPSPAPVSEPITANEPAPASAPTGSGINPVANNSPSDPNAITVTISDEQTPIVILYGPPACGKTMTLVRLTRYLQDQGYQVRPDKSFRDSQDTGYRDLCDRFNSIISSNDAADSTAVISFMLVKILSSTGHPICQILEAPGEHYFNPGQTTHSYPPYISRIINSSNRKVWAVMLEPEWESADIRRGYVDNIRNLKNRLNSNSKVLFVYNKVDKSYARTDSDTFKEVADHYPGIFAPFENQNPISRFWRKYTCDLVRFSTGDYAKKVGGGQTYTPSDDAYPRNMWNHLMKFITG